MFAISNNVAGQRASHHLCKGKQNFQTSTQRLVSGKRLLGPNDDSGTLAVSMKVKASINRLTGAQNNIKKVMGFLEVQDGLLATTGKIAMRISELKGYATQDPIKSEADIASYNNEFKVPAAVKSTGQASILDAVYEAKDPDSAKDFSLFIFITPEGSEATKVSNHNSLLLPALTLTETKDNHTPEDSVAGTGTDSGYCSKAKNQKQHPAGNEFDTDTGLPTSNDNSDIYLNLALGSNSSNKALSRSQVSSGDFEKAIESVIILGAQAGGGMPRLGFAIESIQFQQTILWSALGRIEDLDIAVKSERLAKFGVKMQRIATVSA